MKKFLTLLASLAATFAISAAPQNKPRAADPTCFLTATPSVIAPGSQVTLRWNTTKAKTVKINGTYRSAKGSMRVKPLVKTKYNLLAVGTTNRRCEQSVAVLMVGDAPPALPPETGLTGNLKHVFYMGSHGADYADGGAELYQWMVDNVINVTPTSKRPHVSSPMGNLTTAGAALTAAGIQSLTGVGGPLVTYYPGARYPEDNTWTIERHELYASDMKPFADNAPTWGTKFFYADEPWASCYGYTYAERGTAGENACAVRFWNAWRAKIKEKVADGKFGLSLAEGDGHGRTLQLLRAGLQADMAILESYSTSAKYQDIFGGIHTEFPNVEKVALQDGTRSLCQLFDTYYTPANVTAPPIYPLTIGYWDVNNYDGYRGQIADMMWLANAQEHAQTGQRQFCKQPTAALWGLKGTPLGGWQSTDIETATYNNRAVWHPQDGMSFTSCEYRVVSLPANGLRSHMPSVQATGVETVPWTAIPCTGANPAFPDATYNPAPGAGTPIKVTVGPGANCRHNGQEACQLHVRATNNLGKMGWTRNSFNINHNGLPGYNPSP